VAEDLGQELLTNDLLHHPPVAEERITDMFHSADRCRVACEEQ
jgi:hypothetical protein